MSIIDTISELATDKTEASRLTLPSPIRLIHSAATTNKVTVAGAAASPSSSGTAAAAAASSAKLHNTNSSQKQQQQQQQHPGVPPRNPKVSVPLSSPQNKFNGAKPRFFASSPKKMIGPTPSHAIAKLNLSAIHQRQQLSTNGHHHHLTTTNNAAVLPPPPPVPPLMPAGPQRGQTPDWIRDIFHHAKRGNREKLVS